jgi:1-acyl-sn-glycerol-3-phosphate acyltransferase
MPCAFIGTEKTFPELRRLRRPEITFRIGKVFRLPPVDEENRNADLRKNSDEIMCRIALLLPPSYRGYYADHPRLKELLQEGT